MKNITTVLVSLVLFLSAIVFPSGANGAPAYDGGKTFKDVEGKEWILSEVKSAGKTVRIDRNKLAADNLEGVFTISFQEDRVSGMGAPNRYFGPYTLGSNRSITPGNMASTMMMAFKEPDELKESEYFSLLSNVRRWDLREGKLELYSSGRNKDETTLVFTLK